MLHNDVTSANHWKRMVMVEIVHRSTSRGRANQGRYEGESESDEVVNRDANAIPSGVSESTSVEVSNQIRMIPWVSTKVAPTVGIRHTMYVLAGWMYVGRPRLLGRCSKQAK